MHMNRDSDKHAAALAAVAEIRDGMLVGLGTGSTAAFAITEIGRLCAEGLQIEAVGTSLATEAHAREAGIPLRPLEEVAVIDLAIDGTDEFDPALRAIKRVAQLGHAALPVEVLPIARAYVAEVLAACGGLPILRGGEATPVLTDQGNIIFDCNFGLIDEPTLLAARLSAIPGVMGHGLFLDEVDTVYVADRGTVDRIERSAASPP
jgi:ribose 5-phosphate isomerase A